MHTQPDTTIIIRHPRERLTKCSLRGLETRDDLRFVTFERQATPDLGGRIRLCLNAPPLTLDDADDGLVLVDATWRLAERIERALTTQLAQATPRSIPAGFVTAYPRRQTACPDPTQGLASVEALYVAYRLTGRSTEGLLDDYRWADAFLAQNADRLR